MSGNTFTFVALSLFAAGCGTTGDTISMPDGAAPAGDAAAPVDAAFQGDLASTTGACVAVTRTCDDITAAFALNAADVKVTCDAAKGTFTFRATGVPTYMSNQTTPNAIGDQMWVVQMPLLPTCAPKTTDVINSRGPVGFAVNGIPFYGPQDAQGRDAIQFEGKSFDDCDGHADQSCSYHYHEEPICVFGKGDTAAKHPLADGHPPIVAFALDGFAIYASPAGGGLDACNGHSDAKRGYHYHATPTSPYMVGCYTGTQSAQVMHVPSCTSTGTDGGTKPAPDGGMMMPPPDGGMMMGTPCGPNMTCAQGFVCCPMGQPCANNCVPDCRKGGMCPPMRTCDQNSGVCK